jgi:oligosaccharide repeat unit polymerase
MLVPALAAAPLVHAIASVVLEFGFAKAMVFQAVSTACVYGLLLVRLIARRGSHAEIGILLFVAGMLFWYFVPAIQTALAPEQWEIDAALLRTSNADAQFAFLMVTLYGFLVLSTYQLTASKYLVNWLGNLLGGGRRIPARVWASTIVSGFLISVAYFIIQSGGVQAAVSYAIAGRSVVKPWSPEGNYGTAATPFYNVASTVLVVTSGAALYFVLKGKGRFQQNALCALIVATSIPFLAFLTGTRTLVIQAVLPAVALRYRELLDEQCNRARWIVFGVIAVVATIGLSGVQREHRSSGEISDALEFRINDNDQMTMASRAFVVKRMESGKDFHDSVLLDLFVGPIPRVLWPKKPEMSVVVSFSYYVWGVDISGVGGNTLPSIVGQYYLNWGWLGIVELGVAIGSILKLGDVLFVRRRAALIGFVYMVFVSWIFVSFRMMAFGYFFAVEVALILAFAARLLKTPSNCASSF